MPAISAKLKQTHNEIVCLTSTIISYQNTADATGNSVIQIKWGTAHTDHGIIPEFSRFGSLLMVSIKQSFCSHSWTLTSEYKTDIERGHARGASTGFTICLLLASHQAVYFRFKLRTRDASQRFACSRLSNLALLDLSPKGAMPLHARRKRFPLSDSPRIVSSASGRQDMVGMNQEDEEGVSKDERRRKKGSGIRPCRPTPYAMISGGGKLPRHLFSSPVAPPWVSTLPVELAVMRHISY
jgi:hypothetical protein